MAFLLFLKLFFVDTLHDTVCCVYGILHTHFAAGFSQVLSAIPVQPRFSKPKLEGSDLIIGHYSSLYGAGAGESATLLAAYVTAILVSPNLFFFWPLAFGMQKGFILCFIHNFVNWWRVYRQTYDGTVDPIAFSMHLNSRMEPPSLGLYGHSDMITVEEHQAHDWGLQQAINSGNLHGIEPHMEFGAAWQIEHHLFPNLSGEWFPHITPIIKRMMEEYTLPNGEKVDYASLWYTVERESKVAYELIDEYATKKRKSVTSALHKEALMHDLGFE